MVAMFAVIPAVLAQQGSPASPTDVSDADEQVPETLPSRTARDPNAEAEYEVLRRLLGVEKPQPAPSPVEAPPPVAIPVVDPPPPPAIVPAPATPQPVATPPTPAAPAKARPAPVRKTAPKPAPAPKRAITPAPAAKPVAPAPQTAPQTASPAGADTVATEPTASTTEPATETVAAPPVEQGSDADIPPPGTIITAKEKERWKHLIGPSVQWALDRGARIEVAATAPIPVETARAQATERYHPQVKLSDDRNDMKNYVAGIPFPFVTPDDPDAAIKLVFNQQSRVIVDDVDVRDVSCDTGGIGGSGGFRIERGYLLGHWRRLFYAGRLYHEPKPLWPTVDNVRYREIQHPIIEPFDLKSGGWTYIRYGEAARPDDAWIYYPILRRVRRLSTGQRSQGFFGQDMDLDSYTGFAGHPAWTEWRYLGTKTILGSMHARNIPVKWQSAPADFMFDEPWEPRQVHVVAGRSRSAEYGFGTRVLYIDRESFLIPYNEIYDRHGTLWKALLQSWAFRKKTRADAGGAVFDEFYLPGYSMIDMQLEHVTRCELPSSRAASGGGWYYNYGAAEGTVEDAFDVSGFIEQAH